ncbi:MULTISPECIES: hypothetical protein [unclassified Pseudofrankia]|uniref:hypothetical protein n=1 Tax=unclassified Pseudofrankia TaxID=2994372 RepID=UPI0008DA8A6D|nr:MULTISPECIES: hypothetical protein [unclassified Pseudofrankia]MDT3442347.1 hypothetical protein [Pseudofrankia sp. BMG5.37]OHV47958.1 hypothetical protein BCD48_16995 [Pseudofrankia sp. BMG5.36]
MPSGEHESPLELAEQNPEVLVWLLEKLFDVKVSGYHHARPQPTEVRKLVPSTYRADGMMLLCDAADRSLMSVVLEVQRAWDPGKRWTLKTYVAHLEAELEVNAALLVYCPSAAVARRYREMFESEGVSLHLRPLVFTPGDVPLVVDVERARVEPALAMFSVLCHGGDAGIEASFPALTEALRALGPRKGPLYHEIVLAGLPAALWDRWETHMNSALGRPYRSKLLGETAARAHAESAARMLLTALDARGVHVTEDVRDRIRSCTDLDQFDTWLRRAVTATTIDDVIHE